MNMQRLIERDPAQAILVGALPSDFGFEPHSSFSHEDDWGYDEWSGDYDYSGDFGDDGYGYDFGAAPRRPMRRPPPGHGPRRPPRRMPPHHPQAHHGHHGPQGRTAILQPNEGSEIDVERYTFQLSQAIVIGQVLTAFTTMTDRPATRFRPQRVTSNAPTPFFVFLTEIAVANVRVTVGSGVMDAYNLNPNAVGQALDLPTLSPANPLSVQGNYTGFVPPGVSEDLATFFTISATGPSTMAGGR